MRKLLILALLFVLALPVMAQDEDLTLPDWMEHTECEVDLTGEVIPITHFGDISGSYAFITQPLIAAFDDAIAYYNARGGICGAMLVQDNRDTGGDLSQTQAAYDYYSNLEDTPTLLIMYASPDMELLRSQLIEDEIPVLISAGSTEGLYGEDANTPGWVYATNPLYTDQLGTFCEYVAANPEEYPDPVIGYISWPGAFGEAAFTPETIAYCAELGVGMVETPEYFPPTATDISGQVLNLFDAGANILYTNTLASGPFLMAKTVNDLGLDQDLKLAGVNWAMDITVALLSRSSIRPDGLPAVEGMVGSLPFTWYSEADHPGISLILEQAEANGRTLAQQNITYIIGWSTVDAYKEIYTQTVNRVGSLDAVTGADVKETIDNLDYRPMDLFRLYYPDDLRATQENRLAVMRFQSQDGGIATSGDDALTVPQDDGTNLYIPVVQPITEFAEAPDLRPGAE